MRALRLFAALFAATLLIAASASFAEARRSTAFAFRPPHVIYDGSDVLVKVREWPQVKELKLPDGPYIDLGYIFWWKGGGMWVGHIGSDTQYIQLDSYELAILMGIAGMDQLPPVPDRKLYRGYLGVSPASEFPSDVEDIARVSGMSWLVWVLLAFGALSLKLMWFVRGKVTTFASHFGPTAGPDLNATSAWADAAAKKLEDAPATVPAAKAVPKRVLRPNARPTATGTASNPTRNGFGRR